MKITNATLVIYGLLKNRLRQGGREGVLKMTAAMTVAMTVTGRSNISGGGGGGGGGGYVRLGQSSARQ